MHSGVHHVVGPVAALKGMTHFGQLRIFDLVGCARQAVRAAYFLHVVRCNGKHLIGHEEENDRLRPARATRFCVLFARGLHRVATGARRHNLATRFSIAALMLSSGSTSSTTPVWIASAGMPKIT